YSLALKKTLLEQETTKRKLLVNNMELEKAQLENARLDAERIAKQEKNMRLEQEMGLKNKELTTSTLMVNKHNEVLSQLDKRLAELNGNKEQNETAINQMKQLIRNNISLQNDWENFKTHFDSVHPDFFKILSDRHPELSQNDIRHCAYMRMRMSTKEIARMFNINPTSVQISRVRMKKKMSLTKETDLRQYISNL
ncbi:MAG: hypothetical protein AAF985_27465, partial [Bacteroidota bacterium]